jgi:hydrophobe/amphiphile efflux-1 (HAE1) family protein
MTVSGFFLTRPVATILLSIGMILAGSVAYWFLPVASLPSIDIPTIVVFAARPGADPQTMAASVAAPLERRIGEIPGVSELTSTSSTGNSSIIVQFDIDRDINGAAHDVQAAINAATVDLPSDLPTRPFYRKFNPADAPILQIALSSDQLSNAQLYDAADTVMVQRLSQSPGVSQVDVSGAQQPAVRVQLDPVRLAAAGLSAQDVLTAIRKANVLQPLGGFSGDLRGNGQSETIGINGQLWQADQYAALIVKTVNGTTLRLRDVATVINDTSNTRLAGWDGTQPAILLTVRKEAGANVIDTVNGIRALLPQLQKWLPPDVKVSVMSDRTTSIRASVEDIQYTLLATIALVLMVVLVFMRRVIPTVAAGVTVPLSIAGTLAGMWLLGFSIDNFSLLALTVSVGFVVDDAIVMIENIVRHTEHGMSPMEAARVGAKQIGFTVISITVSLVAVFIPLLFMGGLLGRLFHEFAATLTMAIVISAAVSLTVTPMICGRYMRVPKPTEAHGRLWRLIDKGLLLVERSYARSLDWALAHRAFMLLVTVFVGILTIRMYGLVSKGFFPDQDTGILIGATVADPDISFQTMRTRQREVVNTVLADPAVATVSSSIGVVNGWALLNRGYLNVALKPLGQRHLAAPQVIDRLRTSLSRLRGIQTTLYASGDLRAGGRQGGAAYQYALIAPDVAEMRHWALALEERLKQTPGIVDVSSDQDKNSPQVDVAIDREAAARLGVNAVDVDNALSNAYSQRQVSIIYTARNQYRVVLEIAPALQSDPSLLSRVYVGGTGGKQVPLSAIAHFVDTTAPLGIDHQGQFPAATLSFNLAPGTPLGAAEAAIHDAAAALGMPPDVHTEFAGNAKLLQQSLATQPLLISAALISIYIVLGVLYESLLHPITIVSTLPPAGLGALLALWLTRTDLSIMSMIGIVLLMGIVKKNAIMMVDFALEQERQHGLAPFDAVRAACLARFRPIMMTTLAALFGALPLALAWGTGAELRQPLGIAITGGLIASQMLTLYTTPVIYLTLERWAGKRPPIIQPAEAD